MPDDSAYAFERDESIDAEDVYAGDCDLIVGSVSMNTIARVERLPGGGVVSDETPVGFWLAGCSGRLHPRARSEGGVVMPSESRSIEITQTEREAQHA